MPDYTYVCVFVLRFRTVLKFITLEKFKNNRKKKLNPEREYFGRHFESKNSRHTQILKCTH